MPGPVFLEGETVALRTIEEEDLPLLKRGVNDPDIWRLIGARNPVNGKQEREFFEEVVSDEDSIDLLIAVDSEGVGIVTLRPDNGVVSQAELGYWVVPDHQGQGYGKEAVSRIVEYGFTQRALHRIEARVFECNDASRGLLETLGFEHEGAWRHGTFLDGRYQDIHWYGLLDEEWDGQQH